MKKYVWIVLLLSVNAVHAMEGFGDGLVDSDNGATSGTSEVDNDVESLDTDGESYAGFGHVSTDQSPSLAHQFTGFEDDEDEALNRSMNSQAQAEAGGAGSSAVNALAGPSEETLSLVAKKSLLRGLKEFSSDPTKVGRNLYSVSVPKKAFKDHLDSLYAGTRLSARSVGPTFKHIGRLIDAVPDLTDGKQDLINSLRYNKRRLERYKEYKKTDEYRKHDKKGFEVYFTKEEKQAEKQAKKQAKDERDHEDYLDQTRNESPGRNSFGSSNF